MERKIKTSHRSVLLTTASNTQIASSNPRRYSITFSIWRGTSVASLDGCVVSSQPLTAGTEENILFSLNVAGICVLTLTRDVHGDIVHGDFHALSGNAADR